MKWQKERKKKGEMRCGGLKCEDCEGEIGHPKRVMVHHEREAESV